MQPRSSNSIENASKRDPIIVSQVVKMRPHEAAHPLSPITRNFTPPPPTLGATMWCPAVVPILS